MGGDGIKSPRRFYMQCTFEFHDLLTLGSLRINGETSEVLTAVEKSKDVSLIAISEELSRRYIRLVSAVREYVLTATHLVPDIPTTKEGADLYPTQVSIYESTLKRAEDRQAETFGSFVSILISIYCSKGWNSGITRELPISEGVWYFFYFFP